MLCAGIKPQGSWLGSWFSPCITHCGQGCRKLWLLTLLLGRGAEAEEGTGLKATLRPPWPEETLLLWKATDCHHKQAETREAPLQRSKLHQDGALGNNGRLPAFPKHSFTDNSLSYKLDQQADVYCPDYHRLLWSRIPGLSLSRCWWLSTGKRKQSTTDPSVPDTDRSRGSLPQAP